ncbi:MAG: RHS repeat protein [Firmicutes bacterium]|nr:RHS repeat protein [Bacillota bacterium]
MHYDGAGRLIGIEDADGNLTTIERDSFGNPTPSSGPTAGGPPWN